jgi:hypothetical protein
VDVFENIAHAIPGLPLPDAVDAADGVAEFAKCRPIIGADHA